MAVEIRPKQSSLTVKVDRTDHENLTKRNEPNQHTIAAITGLSDALINLNNLVVDLQEKVNSHDTSATESIESLAINLTDLINNLVEAETNRAKEVEETLTEKIDAVDKDVIALSNEVSAHVDTFQAAQHEIVSRFEIEHERAIAAEDTLNKEIVEERNRALTAESLIKTYIVEEALKARSEEAAIIKTLSATDKKIDDTKSTISSAINAEVGRATAAEELIRSDLTTEIKKAQSSIDNEINRAITEEEKLITEISEIKESIQQVLDFDPSTKADLVDGKLPEGQLPDSIKNIKANNIIEVNTLPAEGKAETLYIHTGTNIIYRWNGAEYVELSSTKFSADETIIIECSLD